MKVSNETNRIAGEYAQISCNITATPPPVILWYYPNGTEISKNNNKMGIINMKSGSTLKIRDLVPEDSGFYKCEGENFMGKVESEISVVVEEAAPEGDGYLLIIGTFFMHVTINY